MGQLCMDLYLKNLRKRYLNSSKKDKALILDEFCSTSGYHRKHAIRMLSPNGKQHVSAKGLETRGRKKTYEPCELQGPLKRIWLATDQMCGKRLKAAIPIWLPFYESAFGELNSSLKDQLLEMS